MRLIDLPIQMMNTKRQASRSPSPSPANKSGTKILFHISTELVNWLRLKKMQTRKPMVLVVEEELHRAKNRDERAEAATRKNQQSSKSAA